MKKSLVIFFKIFLVIFCLYSEPCFSSEDYSKNALYAMYDYHCKLPSVINEHIPTLKILSQECTSVVEIGIGHLYSTFGILYGLSENSNTQRSYLGIDLNIPPSDKFTCAKNLAEANGINFQFLQANDMEIQIENTDLLFIDSLHTYCHLTYELEKFSPYAMKYIAMHDTSYPWGNIDDNAYNGNYSEYPSHIDRNKKGLWPAVEDFLKNHPEWSLHARYFNNNGFTILKRNY